MSGLSGDLPQAQPMDLGHARRLILARRSYWNANNPRRTDYYLRYWLAYPEVPWALLAHLVSNPSGYALTPTEGKRYSPPLVSWPGQPPAWPLSPGASPLFRHLHRRPLPLPVTVEARGMAQVAAWLSPPDAPRPGRFRTSLPADLAEVPI